LRHDALIVNRRAASPIGTVLIRFTTIKNGITIASGLIASGARSALSIGDALNTLSSVANLPRTTIGFLSFFGTFVGDLGHALGGLWIANIPFFTTDLRELFTIGATTLIWHA